MRTSLKEEIFSEILKRIINSQKEFPKLVKPANEENVFNSIEKMNETQLEDYWKLITTKIAPKNGLQMLYSPLTLMVC